MKGLTCVLLLVFVSYRCKGKNSCAVLYRGILIMWSDFACPANQHPKSTIKKKSPETFAHLENFSKMCLPCLIIIRSCYFDYRLNKPFTYSRCVICVSCSVHLISAYYVHKGPWAFLSYPQINGVGKSDHMGECPACDWSCWCGTAKLSHSWEISRYSTRKQCTTSVVVSYAAVFSSVTQRSLRDGTKNGCVGDY